VIEEIVKERKHALYTIDDGIGDFFVTRIQFHLPNKQLREREAILRGSLKSCAM
jgi:hypothetical protein